MPDDRDYSRTSSSAPQILAHLPAICIRTILVELMRGFEGNLSDLNIKRDIAIARDRTIAIRDADLTGTFAFRFPA